MNRIPELEALYEDMTQPNTVERSFTTFMNGKHLENVRLNVDPNDAPDVQLDKALQRLKPNYEATFGRGRRFTIKFKKPT